MDAATKRAGTEIHNLLVGVFADFHDIHVLWQLGALAIGLGVAWWIDRRLRTYFIARAAAGAAPDATLKISVGGLNRIVFPLSALTCVVVGRFVLDLFLPDTHLLDVAVPLLFSLMLVRVVVYALRRVFGPSGLLRQWERGIAWAIWIGVALHITGLLPEVLRLLDSFAFHAGNQRISALTIVQGLVAVAVTVLVALWAGRFVEARLAQAQGIDPNMRVVLSKLSRTLLIVLAVLIALPLVGIDVTVLSVFGGAVGVGIGFGLQKVVANYLSGFAILLDRSISPGALVTIDGHYGQVTRLTARYLVVKGIDGTEAIIPNETVITTVVVNHSYSDRRVRVDLSIQVSYGSDIDLALQLMEQAARTHRRVIADPAPVAVLKSFGESGIELAMYVWIADPEAGKGNLTSDLYRDIWKRFNDAGVEVPFPRREVRILRPAKTAPQPKGTA
ncbi:MAG TPA: mechanosensitive ion channel domain-containing protein [Burkholderiales bacterium]|nr:mechanosensitive ion channel domain-containing protein [Burkholderiales bacterium]